LYKAGLVELASQTVQFDSVPKHPIQGFRHFVQVLSVD